MSLYSRETFREFEGLLVKEGFPSKLWGKQPQFLKGRLMRSKTQCKIHIFLVLCRLNCVFDIFDILGWHTKSCNKQFIKWTKYKNNKCILLVFLSTVICSRHFHNCNNNFLGKTEFVACELCRPKKRFLFSLPDIWGLKRDKIIYFTNYSVQ